MKTILMPRQNGFAIIEALIAFLLLGVGVAALIYLQGNLMVGSSTSKARAEAMGLARDRTEVLRNHIGREQYLSALRSVSDESAVGVNATYTVSYNVLQKNSAGVLSVIDSTNNPLTTDEVQNLTVKVSWEGSEGASEEILLDNMLYFMSPVIASAIEGGDGDESSYFPLLSPLITGVEGKHPSTAKIINSNSESESYTGDDITIDDGDADPSGITVTRYTAATGSTLDGRSNVEVTYGLNPDGSDKVVLTSFGGIVHRIKGKIITDRFSVPLDANNDSILDDNELRNYWIDGSGSTIADTFMQPDEVKYWIDGAGVIVPDPDGIIQDDEYTYWIDADGDDVVDDSEFDPPEATAKASSTIEDLSVLGSPPSFCLFPICDDSVDQDCDYKVPVDPALALDDDDPINDNVDQYGIASYVCYVPGDCTYQDVYAGIGTETEDLSKLNGCPDGFNPPTDDDFPDLNGGWYGRIGNFGVKLNPDDMVCTTDTTKTHLTPSREYVTYRCKVALDPVVDGICPDDDSDEINGNGNIIANEGINTPYSNQTFIIARKNNKPSVYCPIRALSYEGNLVNEQIKRELSGLKKFEADGSPDDTPVWDKNIVLPENVCTLGLSCPP